jgi:8-oxo-dGTP diphosphatase
MVAYWCASARSESATVDSGSFLGGKLHEGEDLLAATTRELSEELGLAVTSLGRTLFARQDPNSPFFIEFVEVKATGEPVAHEHAAIAWVTPLELTQLPLAPTDRAFAHHLAIHHA